MKKTLWETSNRTFLGDLEFGAIGEQRVIAKLKSYKGVSEVRDISKTQKGIKDDIDVEIVYSDGHTSTVEIKTDTMAHRTGNIAYEEFSHKNPGCFARTKAKHIVYLLYHTGKAYVLDINKFRAFIAEMKKNKEKASKLGVRFSRMGEGASGYLVPIKSIIDTDIVECEINVA